MTLRRSGAHPPRPSRGPTEAAPPKAPHGTRPGGALFLSLGGLLALAATLRFSGLAYRDLWFDELGSVALAATGSLWESPLLHTQFTLHLHAQAPMAKVIQPQSEPVTGALLLARGAA